MGDLVMCTGAFRELRRALPQARLTLLTTPAMAPLVRANPHFDDILFYDREGRDRGRWGFARRVWELRRRRYDLVVDLQSSARSRWIARALVAGLRVGNHRGFFYHLAPPPYPPITSPERPHAVDRVFEILGLIGIDGVSREPEFHCTAEEDAAGPALWSEAGLVPGEAAVVFSPGASPRWSTKRWPAEHFVSLGRGLLDEYPARVVLVGLAADADALGEMAAGIGPRALSAAGRTTAGELAALLRRADLAVSTDSAPMHLAAAVGCPVVALFGATNHRASRPYGKAHRVLTCGCERSPCFLPECPEPCLARIAPERVLDEARAILGPAAGDHRRRSDAGAAS